jgi:DNA polymerase-3 subunit alpha
MTSTFVHLHLHTEYSLVDSTIRIDRLVNACAAAGMPAVAMTDDSNLFALVKFYNAAEKAGLKPIIGCDLWVGDRGDDLARTTVLCQNRDGYLRLSRLLSAAYRQRGKSERVFVPRAQLLADNAGIVALLGRHSELSIASDIDAADRLLEDWRAAFGDRLYLELTRIGRSDEPAQQARLLHLAGRRDVPVVASNDTRFLAREDFEAHEARVCIASGRVLNDPKRPHDYTDQQYLKTPAEMRAAFADCPQAIENAVELAKRLNIEMSFGKYFLPAFPVPPEHTLDSYIRAQAHAGLETRLAAYRGELPFPRETYLARLDAELDVIVKMGFPGYFLIVADFINWSKQNGIPVGPGRGSGAGSLVAYALAITDLDPLPQDLLFERFLNPERVSMPDFDVDFCMEGRDRVIDYVSRTYGADKVSQIITYGTMAAKAVVRDTGRVLGMGYGHVDSIAKLIPTTLGITLDDAIAESAELRERMANEEEVATLIELARKLEDLTRNAGKHAGGVVIAPTPLPDFAPLYCEEGGEGVVTQFDKDDVEKAGLVKFDFLGLRTLTIIDWAVKAINAGRAANGEAPLDITQLPMDDAATYALLSRGDTTAVFQFESRGMKDYIRKLQPQGFDDIVALAALFRPGPLGAGMVDDFIERRHGRAEVSYPHPSLEPILKPTYGVIVYQEQVMQIAQVMAGYTLGGADLLRRAMGKKIAAEMAQQREIFESGAARNGVAPETARSIFDLMEKFADYGFNKSHSAAYALVAYQTAWLKAHYPAEFMAATLSSDMDHTEKLVGFLDDARDVCGLEILKPDINASTYMFEALDAKRIRYGLGAIKGVGRAACEAISDERQAHGVYASLDDLAQRVDSNRLNKRVLEALVLSGALDGFGHNRASLMNHLPEAMRGAEQQARNRDAGQIDIFGNAAVAAAPTVAVRNLPEWPLLQRLHGERDTLGHYLSGHPADAYKDWLRQLVSGPIGKADELYRTLQGTAEKRRGQIEVPIVFGGVVPSGLRRRGDSMGFAAIEDATGRIEVGLFREALTEYAAVFAKDQMVIVAGGLSIDEYSGGYQLKLRQAWTLAQACERFARGLRIHVADATPKWLDQLARTLKPALSGPAAVRLLYQNRSARAELQLGDAWRVRILPEVVEELRRLEGVNEVQLSLTRANGN